MDNKDMKVLALASLALLGACEHPQVQDVSSFLIGDTPHFVSAQDVGSLARCIAKNAGTVAGSIVVRQYTRPDGSQDVVLTAGHDVVNKIAAAHVKAAAAGATAVISVDNQTFAPGARRARLLRDC